MSQLGRKTALLRGLRAPIAAAKTARRIPCAVTGANHQTRWASSDTKKGPASSRERQEGSFKGQMLESIQQRLAREKVEMRQAALEREAKGGSRNLATTFSEFARPPRRFAGSTRPGRDGLEFELELEGCLSTGQHCARGLYTLG